MNKNFGKRVKNIWNDLRPMTKEMLERAMSPDIIPNKRKFAYDAHLDRELSILLSALDEEAKGDSAAHLAVEVYVYRIRKYIGAYMAALGRVDAIVFTGGVGENSAEIRRRTCGGL